MAGDTFGVWQTTHSKLCWIANVNENMILLSQIGIFLDVILIHR